MQIEAFRGDRIAAIAPAVARLRVTVFRDFPYLYDGTQEYEEQYLATYARSPSAAIFVAFDGEDAVGASTCLRMTEETENIRAPVAAAGWNPDTLCYFGESVLLSRYRGQGVGVRFFELREAHARTLGCTQSAFCAVQRPANHPARPQNYQPLNEFWRRRGYIEYPSVACKIAWKEVGQSEETPKRLVFWRKNLA